MINLKLILLSFITLSLVLGCQTSVPGDLPAETPLPTNSLTPAPETPENLEEIPTDSPSAQPSPNPSPEASPLPAEEPPRTPEPPASEAPPAEPEEEEMPHPNLAEGLNAFYPFSGNAEDAHHANHGQINNALPTEDRFGQENNAYLFENNANIQFTVSNQLDGFEAFSLSFWMKPKNELNSSSARQDIFFKVLDGCCSTWKLSYGDSSGALQFMLIGSDWKSDDDNTQVRNRARLDLEQDFMADAWYHVTVVFDKNANYENTLQFYINGQRAGEVTNNTLDGQNMKFSSEVLYIGRNPQGNAFTGSLDDIRIYNKALSPDIIQALAEDKP